MRQPLLLPMLAVNCDRWARPSDRTAAAAAAGALSDRPTSMSSLSIDRRNCSDDWASPCSSPAPTIGARDASTRAQPLVAAAATVRRSRSRRRAHRRGALQPPHRRCWWPLVLGPAVGAANRGWVFARRDSWAVVPVPIRPERLSDR